MNDPWVSVIIPVIRREKAKRCVEAIESGTYPNFEIVMDFDDDRIGAPKMVNRLVARSHSDIVCFVGDDTIPDPNMLRAAVDAMGHFIDEWGLIGINDNIRLEWQKDKAAHFLMHKKLLAYTDGEMFHEGYAHCYCDNELIERAMELGRYVMCKEAYLFHDHPAAYPGDPDKEDDDYRRVYGDKNYIHDLILFRRRKKSGWKNQ